MTISQEKLYEGLFPKKLTAQLTWNRDTLGRKVMDGKAFPLIERETELGLEILAKGAYFYIQQEELNEYRKQYIFINLKKKPKTQEKL